MAEIRVAEMFHSIQGEGPHAGTPAVFLRLAGCNLVCGGRDNLQRDREEMTPEGDATWVCDTIDVWREASEVYDDPSELINEWRRRGWLGSLQADSHLIVTGGEPMLEYNQEAFRELYDALDAYGISPFVEIETNGTIIPDRITSDKVDQFNVSLKLANSGMERETRINDDAIDFFIIIHEATQTGAKFKFVVSNFGDVNEITELAHEYDIPKQMISLMPAGQTREQLSETYEFVAEACKQHGLDFSPRLQVDIWNEVTGV